ncbi:hypothetical protein CHUAL_008079 [Chamberlinius hualienensis]
MGVRCLSTHAHWSRVNPVERHRCCPHKANNRNPTMPPTIRRKIPPPTLPLPRLPTLPLAHTSTLTQPSSSSFTSLLVYLIYVSAGDKQAAPSGFATVNSIFLIIIFIIIIISQANVGLDVEERSIALVAFTLRLNRPPKRQQLQ